MPRAFVCLLLAGLAILPRVAEAGRLHYISIVDYHAERVGPDLTDAPIVNALTNHIPEELWERHELPLGPISEADVLGLIREIPVADDDAVLLYYVGHGNYDRNIGTYMTPSASRGESLSATATLQALKARGPRLAVVVFDCCNRERARVSQLAAAPTPGPPPQEISPLFRALFFDVQGAVLVVSSSPNEYALVRARDPQSLDPEAELPYGSIFTTAFGRTLEAEADRPQRWSDTIRSVQARLDRLFNLMKRLRRPLTLDGGQRVTQPRQTIQLRFFN